MESKAHLPLQYFHTLFGYRCWRRNVLVTTIKSWCRFFLSPTSYLLTLASGANIQKCHQHRNSVTNGDSPFKKIFGAIRVWLQWSRFTSFYWHQCAFSASTQFGDVWWCWWLKCYQHIEISTISIFVTKDSHQRHYSLDFILNCNSVTKVTSLGYIVWYSFWEVTSLFKADFMVWSSWISWKETFEYIDRNF